MHEWNTNIVINIRRQYVINKAIEYQLLWKYCRFLLQTKLTIIFFILQKRPCVTLQFLLFSPGELVNHPKETLFHMDGTLRRCVPVQTAWIQMSEWKKQFAIIYNFAYQIQKSLLGFKRLNVIVYIGYVSWTNLEPC